MIFELLSRLSARDAFAFWAYYWNTGFVIENNEEEEEQNIYNPEYKKRYPDAVSIMFDAARYYSNNFLYHSNSDCFYPDTQPRRDNMYP